MLIRTRLALTLLGLACSTAALVLLLTGSTTDARPITTRERASSRARIIERRAVTRRPMTDAALEQAAVTVFNNRAARWHLAEVMAANERAEQEAAARAARARAAQRASRGSNRSWISGSCAAMKPPGFPDWIIERESGGDPTASNPSGAYGCAQLMPSSGGSGTYAERWARLWANGAGYCHWKPPDYCAG